MKLKHKFLIILFFSMIYICVKRNSSIFAMSQSDAGKYIAEFSVNFFENYADQTVYSYDDNQRTLAYRGIKTSGKTSAPYYKSFSDKYAFDCVGWVSFAIHQSLGIGSNSTMTFFGQPRGYGQVGAFFNGFKAIKGNPNSWTKLSNEEIHQTLQPGDLLLSTYQHILIYVGDDQVVHCTGGGPGASYGGNKGYGIVRNKLSELNYQFACIGRITESTAASINESSATTLFNGSQRITYNWLNWGDESASNKTKSTGKGWIVDPDDKLELFKHILFTEKYNFNYINWKRYGHDFGNSGSSRTNTSSSATPANSNGLNTSSSGGDNKNEEVNTQEGYRGTFTDSKNRTYKEYKQGYEPWKSVKYGGGDIWGKGCGPVSLAIIANGYGINETAATIAEYMVGNTSAEKLKDALINFLHLSATVHLGKNKEKLKENLLAGRPVVLSVENSPTNMFTNNSHIMAGLSINDKDEVWVSNPNSGKANGWIDIDTVVKHLSYIITIDSDK